MRFSTGVAVTLAAGAHAFPGMANVREEMKRNAAPEPVAEPEPQLLSALGSTVSSLTNTVDSLLGSVASSVDPNNLRPEPGYKFVAPGPNDSRGPCPGLNLLANYGYLPHNGYVSGDQVLEAVSRGFNMGADLATVLIIFAVLSDGSIKDQSWYLGTNPVSGVGGLNRHSTVEADISPNKEDYYNGCGDNHHISSRLFAQNVQYVAQSPEKQFSIPVMAKHFATQADFAKKYNPSLYYFPFPMIVSVVAYNFYPRFFSNGTSEAGGVANYESISSIVGASYQKKTGQFKYVPERWPANWYRRSFAYGAVEALTEGFTKIYPANPVLPPGFLELGPDGKLNVTATFCELYYGISSISPLALSGDEAIGATKIGWALGLLNKNFAGTLSGCVKNSTSKNGQPFLFPYPDQMGAPGNPGPKEQKNAGNNIYNKVHFKTAPTTRTCDHTFDS